MFVQKVEARIEQGKPHYSVIPDHSLLSCTRPFLGCLTIYETHDYAAYATSQIRAPERLEKIQGSIADVVLKYIARVMNCISKHEVLVLILLQC